MHGGVRGGLSIDELSPAAIGARASGRLRVLLVDPSLFTAPYDAALTRGLAAADVDAHWATRRLRPFEEAELDPAAQTPLFYPVTDCGRMREGAAWRLVKGVEHAVGLRRVARMAAEFDVVHFQWAMLPLLDARTIRAIRRIRPVVVTIHDTQPFNGKAMSILRTAGTRGVLAASNRIIVHTEAGRSALVAAGVPDAKIAVVPHGLLPLTGTAARDMPRGGRWRIVLFGRIQSYKGLDVLVEALGGMTPAERAQIEVVVAGAPAMDLAPVQARIAELGFDEAVLRLDLRYLGADEMAACLASADTFVLPYRAIEASGVLFTIAGLDKWIVASDVGAFRDLVGQDGAVGELVPPGDAAALGRALLRSIGRVPAAQAADRAIGWPEIGQRTRAVYEAALAEAAA
jgi:glycosyltransferase involved in cell wall biosynthesis